MFDLSDKPRTLRNSVCYFTITRNEGRDTEEILGFPSRHLRCKILCRTAMTCLETPEGVL
jgi:hypothetical protein